MLDIRSTAPAADAQVIVLPVAPRADRTVRLLPLDPDYSDGSPDRPGSPNSWPGTPGSWAGSPGSWAAVVEEVHAYLASSEHTGAAGSVEVLPRPGRTPAKVLLAGVGEAEEADWRSLGAAVVRAAARDPALTVVLPAAAAVPVRGLAEGAWLAGYRYRLGADDPASAPRLAQLTLAAAGRPTPVEPTPVEPAQVEAAHVEAALVDQAQVEAALAEARTFASATILARDLTNTPSQDKSPAWLADRIAERADGRANLRVTVLGPDELAAGGFGGILAVGAGSVRSPRLVQLEWRPRGARRHAVLVGKGITFDSGGISIKTRDGMLLMRKDMAGAAAAGAALLGAAELALPVRVTALLPLAENLVSGTATRPGDVIRHYGGRTSEVQDTDAEGRLVLADALAYAAGRLRPDVLVDLATLTGSARVALGRRTAALFSHDDELAGALVEAGRQAGEAIWRMPLAEEYLPHLHSEVADATNLPAPAEGGGAITAALFLREFTGDLRPHWAHLDMSAPAWSEQASGELAKGATGWGVRTLLRWLTTLAEA